MTPDEIRAIPPKFLSEAQRESYFETGYLLVEKAISDDWIERLCATTEEMIDRSRAIGRSDAVWDLEEGHGAAKPRLRRLSSPNDEHPTYWDYAAKSIVPDIVADLVGPNVKFHHSKLNFKWAEGGEAVKWHQDIGFWPHTNYSPLTVGTYLYDCGPDQGPLCVVSGSHNDGLLDQYNDEGEWVGCLSDADAAEIDMSRVRDLEGPAGSITIHNCRTIHSSRPNNSPISRPLLLNVYAAVDAFAYTVNPLRSRYDRAILRGGPVRWAHHDPRPCLMPPDWSGGYTSIFALQQEEDRHASP